MHPRCKPSAILILRSQYGLVCDVDAICELGGTCKRLLLPRASRTAFLVGQPWHVLRPLLLGESLSGVCARELVRTGRARRGRRQCPTGPPCCHRCRWPGCARRGRTPPTTRGRCGRCRGTPRRGSGRVGDVPQDHRVVAAGAWPGCARRGRTPPTAPSWPVGRSGGAEAWGRVRVGDVPQDHRAVVAGGGQGVPVGGERHRPHGAGVAGERGRYVGAGSGR